MHLCREWLSALFAVNAGVVVILALVDQPVSYDWIVAHGTSCLDVLGLTTVTNRLSVFPEECFLGVYDTGTEEACEAFLVVKLLLVDHPVVGDHPMALFTDLVSHV